MWRYLPLLPVKSAPENKSLRVGGTPLVDFPCIASELKISRLQIKDDTRNPSGSLKDRASELAIQHAKEQGKKTIVAASTGNAGSSLAALSAYHGMNSIILAPATAPIAKLTQILQHGAQLVPVDGNYDAAFDLAFEWAQKHGSYCRNTGINPILAEGKKTVALEIAEQNDWKVPDHIFVPVGDGCIISGVYEGFFDLLSLKWIDFMPAIHAVQAEGSAAIVDSLVREGDIQSVSANTIADSISVDQPRDGDKARRAITRSGGKGFKVSDDDILKAQKLLSETTGIFAEPAAAAAYAGFLQASETGVLKSGNHVVVLLTGSGLKDTASAQKLLRPVEAVKATLVDIENYLEKLQG
ncbi:MAG: threonine synthase [FCB group bacterium]|nr:threonine synthase [FCB group bacterium]MBL7027175.1 threonine synthase [Candidatus Neomarinimicrobiota bacterium]MBL7120590.1 threonine synthase [Candidatus Neomarinimicrobiota bacterium]